MSVLSRSARPEPAPPAAASRLASPSAGRARRPGWRDPRLALGVLLVVGSVLLGARLMASADDTVLVLGAAAPLAAGQELEAGDVAPVRLRFSSAVDADRYLPGDADLPADAVLLRPVGAGELIPRAAVGDGADGRLVEVPLAVDPALVPAGVGRGSVVDVWVAPVAGTGTGSGTGEGSAPLLRAVPVLSASRGGAVGTGALRQVVVGVPATDEPEVARVVARLGEDATLMIVRRAG